MYITERVVEYMLKEEVPDVDFLELHSKQAKISKRHMKANLVFRLDARYNKMDETMGCNTLAS